MKATSNCNDYVWVQLTDAGRKVLQDNIEEMDVKYRPAILTSFGSDQRWSRFQLWELMEIFGNCMYNGNPNLPFMENTLYHTDPTL